MILPCLFVAPSEKGGRGVFSTEILAKGSLIEVSPVIVMNAKDRVQLDKTHLYGYIFEWGHNRKSCALALGYISLYNHSYAANCEYEMDFEEQIMYIRTVRAIKSGEELFLNYNGSWNDETPVWFEAD